MAQLTKSHTNIIFCLLMFPQIVETMYSPALTDISSNFFISPEQAGQTLSIYFFAFALGVFFWGRLCDLLGRRLSMLLGLLIYTFGVALALLVSSFTGLLVARFFAAFGVAVGSIVTQTMLRDSYTGKALNKIFAFMGIGIAISPIIGLLSGSILTECVGYRGVFVALLFLAVTLFFWTYISLPETQNSHRKKNYPIVNLIQTMCTDSHILRSVILIAFMNVMIFSYYTKAPFIFETLGYSPKAFGYTGIFLAFGSILGAQINKQLLRKNYHPYYLIFLASCIGAFGAFGVYLYTDNIIFILPMILIVITYSMAIPNILSTALIHYKKDIGTAGAIFGLMYYLSLALGLTISASIENLGLILLICITSIFIISLRFRSNNLVVMNNHLE